MNTITDKITRRIRAKRRGWVFTPKDFLDMGPRAAVDQVLSRLVKQGKIRRLDFGLYDFPKQHATLGTLSPDTDSIAQALAKKYGDQVAYPSGAMAANLLGLSTQIPAKPTYMINGLSRTKNVAGRIITFKHARVSLMGSLSDIVNHLLQALSYLGKNNIDNDVIQRCAARLDSRDIKSLNRAAAQVPTWMADILKKIQRAYYGTICQTV